MQGDNDAGDYISRAKAKIARWNALFEQQQREGRFDNHSAEELVHVAESGRTLDGQKLEAIDYNALHGVWQATFGEGLEARTRGAENAAQPQPPLDQHPLMTLPDDQMLRPRDVVRLCGIPKTTLKRWRQEGKFPQSKRITPASMPRHVGWPARELKAWLRSTWN